MIEVLADVPELAVEAVPLERLQAVVARRLPATIWKLNLGKEKQKQVDALARKTRYADGLIPVGIAVVRVEMLLIGAIPIGIVVADGNGQDVVFRLFPFGKWFAAGVQSFEDRVGVLVTVQPDVDDLKPAENCLSDCDRVSVRILLGQSASHRLPEVGVAVVKPAIRALGLKNIGSAETGFDDPRETTVVTALVLDLVPVRRRLDRFLWIDQSALEDGSTLRKTTFVEDRACGRHENLKRRQPLLSIDDPPAVDESRGGDLFRDDRTEEVRLGLWCLAFVEDLLRQSPQIVPEGLPLSLPRPHVVPLITGNGVLLQGREGEIDGSGLCVQH